MKALNLCRLGEMLSTQRARRRAGVAAVAIAAVLAVGLASFGFGLAFLNARQPAETGVQSLAAVRAAQLGVEHYRKQFALDERCFDSLPRGPQACGDGSFRLESATEDRGQWTIVVVGRRGESTHRTTAAIGTPYIEIPAGIVVASDHRSAEQTFRLGDSALIASYDPRVGTFGGDNVGREAKVTVNGSLTLAPLASVLGDVSATGGLIGGDSLSISGTLTENDRERIAENVDPTVRSLLESSRAANNNAVLSTIFGPRWTPQSPVEENYGDLIVERGSHVIPSGVYRVRRFEVRGGATVVFNTTAGPSTLVYVGGGPRSDLTVEDGSSLVIDPGSTRNGLLTVLGDGTDLRVRNFSVFGQAMGADGNAGYSRIIGLGAARATSEVAATNGSRVYARVHATAHRLVVEEDSGWHGSAVIGSLAIDESYFAVDVGALGSTIQNTGGVELARSAP